jgi:hypothetical protein
MPFSIRPRTLLLSLVIAALALPAAADARTLNWSGYTWQVRHSPGIEGPGPNWFSDSPSSAYIDKKDKLHLRVTRDPATGMWTSAEVFSDAWLGNGKYTWVVEAPGDAIDTNLTVGMYKYYDLTHEIDVELAKWGLPANPINAQYTVQPWTTPGNQYSFKSPAGVTTYSFDERPGQVTFAGNGPNSWTKPWTYTGINAYADQWYAPVHMNLWQYDGLPPANGRDFEIVFRSFRYTP